MSVSQQIRRKRLGPSDIQIPEIGFGTWKYRASAEPLRCAIELGATFIDTAETYGCEEVVGQAIRGRRNEIFLASKARPANFHHNDLIRACEGSLRRLGTDYLDLYQLHWPNYTIPIEETMGAMERLVESGKIRSIGVSNFSVRDLKAAQSALRKCRIVSNQVRYSLMDRTIEGGLLDYCKKHQITIIAFSPFGTDFLSLQKHDPEGILTAIARKYQRTVAHVALNWVLRNESVVTIPKASSLEHVREDCGASGWMLTESDYELLSRKIRFRKRSPLERMLRNWGRHLAQMRNREI